MGFVYFFLGLAAFSMITSQLTNIHKELVAIREILSKEKP